MAAYRVWRNSLTGVYYRVADDGQSKVVEPSQTVIDIDVYASGAVFEADSSALRAWLNSIPNA